MKNEIIELIKGENGVWELKATKPAETANLEDGAGILGGIAQTKVFGIPIGEAAGGLLTASAWDALAGFIAGKIPAMPAWLIPAVGSWVTARYFGRFMGSGVANAGSLILAADAIQQFFNLRGLLSGLMGKGTAKLSAGGPGGDKVMETARAANAAIADYYAGLGGRR